ncbi:transmembrane protein 139 [Bombina bombina]|uniref:transmembrane protein 139 n=1 Tax=Bombina bombina TaxID=8345 RepID=UPI00235AEA7E|nr:transmembrane protein 139 [Bombina bombina]
MASTNMRRGIQRTVVTLGLALVLIGVVLLTVSERAFIMGICFLAVGSFGILCYLIVTISFCIKKAEREEDEASQAEAQTQSARQPQAQTETDTRQFDAPRYEDVILYRSATVWTVTLGPPPGPDPEPPPYSALASGRMEAVGDLRLHHPTLYRISSDIHEFKGVFTGERHLEPLTPPPSYDEAFKPWDDVFEPSQ